MPTLDIEVDARVFVAKFVPFLFDDTPEQFYYGSAGSGKSQFIFQRTILDLCDAARADRNFLIMRNTQRSNRDSTFNELEQAMRRFGVYDYFDISRSELVITSETTGRMAACRGADDPEKLKSFVPKQGPLTDIILEEMTEFRESDYDDLWLRLRGAGSAAPKRVTGMFNPTFYTHWIRSRWKRIFLPEPFTVTRLSDRSAIAHHTTHWDNQFLTEQDHQRYEKLKTRSQYHYDVYARGIWGVLGGSILTNWEVDDLSALYPAYEDRMRNGVDFGFSDDEAAFVRCAIRPEDGAVLVFDVPVYQTGLTNDRLGKQVFERCGGSQLVTCDSAEPKSIFELGQCGVMAVGAKKGKDSVNHGIQWLQQRKIVVDRSRCQPLINELQQWQWKKDRQTGKNLPEPVDAFDHAISALRYALESDMAGAGAQLW